MEWARQRSCVWDVSCFLLFFFLSLLVLVAGPILVEREWGGIESNIFLLICSYLKTCTAVFFFCPKNAKTWLTGCVLCAGFVFVFVCSVVLVRVRLCVVCSLLAYLLVFFLFIRLFVCLLTGLAFLARLVMLGLCFCFWFRFLV